MLVTHSAWGVITQNGKPIAFYSRKLNAAQTRHTATERELLSIVEIPKEFRNILFGQELVIHTDHKNLTCKELTTEQVLRQRLIIEEFNPIIQHKPGKDNIVADSLSRLPREGDTLPIETNLHFQENFGNDELDDDIFPVSYSLIDKEQQKDKKLLAKLKLGHYGITSFLGGDKTVNLVTWKEKIVIPSSPEDWVARWHHAYLLHPGINRTEAAIWQCLHWLNMTAKIRRHCETCPTCQVNKKTTKKMMSCQKKRQNQILGNESVWI